MDLRSDRLWLAFLLALSALAATGPWLARHPGANPFSPLALGDPDGWATARKLAALRDDPPQCRAFLARSSVAFAALAPTGEGACRRADRGVLHLPESAGAVLSPAGAQATCAISAGLARWVTKGVEPAARAAFGLEVTRIEHYGTGSCRRIGGKAAGAWSEHATGNAIDVAGFVLSDGRRVTVREGWHGRPDERAFLRTSRASACRVFATVLSPDYNADHADHLHLDQARRGAAGSYCR